MLGAAKTPDEIMGEADHLRGNALMHLACMPRPPRPMPPPSTTVPTASAARCSPTAARRSPPWATTRRPLRLSLPLRRMLPMPRRSRPIWAWAMRCSSRATMPTREPPSVRLPSTAPIRLLPPHSASSVVASLSSAVRRMPWRLIARLSTLPAPATTRVRSTPAWVRRFLPPAVPPTHSTPLMPLLPMASTSHLRAGR